MDSEDFQQIALDSNQTGILLDLDLMRFGEGVLDDRPFFDYFVLLNNCGNSKILSQMNSEFDYPAIKAFYKEKAPQILASVPSTLTVRIPGPSLGVYGPATASFPWRLSGGAAWNNASGTGPFKLNYLSLLSSRVSRCIGGVRRYGSTIFNKRSGDWPVYQVTFPTLTFASLPMNEEAAKKYVESLGPREVRMTSFILSIEILPQSPQLKEIDAPMTRYARELQVTFAGQVKKVTVVSGKGEPLAEFPVP
jgi:hypothetical protein